MFARQIRVRGRVQGVGYRDALRAKARRAGVSGWVRNRADGSVEALLQGTPEAVAEVIAWARRGPALARVAQLDEAPPAAEDDPPCAGFDIRPSA